MFCLVTCQNICFVTTSKRLSIALMSSFYSIVFWLSLYQQSAFFEHPTKWPSMQRQQCPIYNGILESSVWSSINYRYQGFCHLTLFIFIYGFSVKLTCALLAYKKQLRNSQSLTLLIKEGIFHIFDEIKTSRVPLLIGYWHLCMEAHFYISLTVPLSTQIHFCKSIQELNLKIT